MPKLTLKKLYNKHYPSILVTFLGETEHFSGKIEALNWGISVGKQKHNVQKPTNGQVRHSRDVHVGMYFGKPASVRPLSTPCRGRIVALQDKRFFVFPNWNAFSLRTHVSSESTGDNWAFQLLRIKLCLLLRLGFFRTMKLVLMHVGWFTRRDSSCIHGVSLSHATESYRVNRPRQYREERQANKRNKGEHRASFVSVTGNRPFRPR